MLNTKHSSVYFPGNINRAVGVRSAASGSNGAGRLLLETKRGHQLQTPGTFESSSKRWWHRSEEDPGAPSGSVFIRRRPNWRSTNVVSADFRFNQGFSCCISSGTNCFISPQVILGSLYFPSWISGDANFYHVYSPKVKDVVTVTSISATKNSHNFNKPPPPHQLQE